jgi:putative transposase
MRMAGLRGISRRRVPTTTQREPSHSPANDLVGRDFRAPGPTRLWVADITYVPTAAGFLFAAVVLDAWSRRIVGWAMATGLRSRLVLDALDMAVTTRKPADVVHRSDQGSHYTSVAFGFRCKGSAHRAGRRPSLHRLGRRCLRHRHGRERLIPTRQPSTHWGNFSSSPRPDFAVPDQIER